MRGSLKILKLVVILLSGSSACVCAQRVEIRQGNVYFTDRNEETTRLTSGGADSHPALSLDCRKVVFVRATQGELISTGEENVQATELWLVGVDGKNESRLLRGRNADKMEDVLADFSAPQFSPDGKEVYFLSSAWTTSRAVHAVAVASTDSRFVCAGNDLEVSRKGEYAGKLIVQQHRYFLGGGSYDWYWLMDSNGTELGVIGETAENFKDLLLK